MTSAECWIEGDPGMLEQHGPMVSVHIGLDNSFHPSKANEQNLPATQVPALVDTGAYLSCIDWTIAEKLGLRVVDKEKVGGVHGAQCVNIHLAQIYIPDLDFLMGGVFIGANLRAAGLPPALLGRDFLRDFTMVYEGQTGTVRITKA